MTTPPPQDGADHYEECPQHEDPGAPLCHCDGINQADENYWQEPPGFNG